MTLKNKLAKQYYNKEWDELTNIEKINIISKHPKQLQYFDRKANDGTR